MPKLKHISLSQSVFQAKKRKRSQREDTVKQQQERQRHSMRHQLQSTGQHRQDSVESEESRRQRDAEAHQICCLDAIRRQLKQGNWNKTAVHRQVCQEDLGRRQQ